MRGGCREHGQGFGPLVLGIVATAAFCAAAYAREPAPDALRLTLAEAVDRARAESPRLARLRALESAADAGVREARALRTPFVDLSAGYTRYSDVPEYPPQVPDGPAPVFLNIPDAWRARLGVTAPLYAGGRIDGGIVAALRSRDAAGREIETGDADLVLETTVAYWWLVTARESERVLGEGISAYEAHLADARNRERLGMAARNEVLAVEVERDRAELARLAAANGSAAAEASLARLLGFPPGARIEPVEPLEPAESPAEAPGSLAEDAVALRPERAALAARLAAAEAVVRVERSAGRPQVSVGAGWEYANPSSRYLPPRPDWNDTWSVGIGLAFSVFDGGRASAAAARAESEAVAIRRQIDDLERGIRLEVTTRALDVETARAAVEVASRSVASAEENRRVSAERYRAGAGLSSELLDAETGLLRAGLERTDALARLRTAQARLDRAAGR